MRREDGKLLIFDLDIFLLGSPNILIFRKTVKILYGGF